MNLIKVSLFYKYNQLFLTLLTAYPLKPIKALCQMLLNPAHYIPHLQGFHPELLRLEKARKLGLAETRKRLLDDSALQRFTSSGTFLYKFPKKGAINSKGTKDPFYDETLAIEVAFWMVARYKLDIHAAIPWPVGTKQKVDTSNLRIPGGQDYIFDGGNWEDPGISLDLGSILSRFKDML